MFTRLAAHTCATEPARPGTTTLRSVMDHANGWHEMVSKNINRGNFEI